MKTKKTKKAMTPYQRRKELELVRKIDKLTPLALLALITLGCESHDDRAVPDASPMDAVSPECVAPPVWPDPDLTVSPIFVRMSWDDWVSCSHFAEAMIAYNSCYVFDPPGDCGPPPVVVPLPIGEPDGTNSVVTIKVEDWDAYTVYVDSAQAWGACVEGHCPDGVCR